MSHIGVFHFINFIGAIVGAVGVIIALYLQFITSKKCPPRYIILFLVFGTTMIMINSRLVLASSVQVLFLQLTAYIILAVVEVVAAYSVWSKLDLESPMDELPEDLVPDDYL